MSDTTNSTFASRRDARTKKVSKADNKAVQTSDNKGNVDDIIDGNVDDVVARIGTDPELAAKALEAEQARGADARKGVVAHASKVIEDAGAGAS